MNEDRYTLGFELGNMIADDILAVVGDPTMNRPHSRLTHMLVGLMWAIEDGTIEHFMDNLYPALYADDRVQVERALERIDFDE